VGVSTAEGFVGFVKSIVVTSAVFKVPETTELSSSAFWTPLSHYLKGMAAQLSEVGYPGLSYAETPAVWVWLLVENTIDHSMHDHFFHQQHNHPWASRIFLKHHQYIVVQDKDWRSMISSGRIYGS